MNAKESDPGALADVLEEFARSGEVKETRYYDIGAMAREILKTRAAIERVRALCDKPHQFVVAWEVLRAIDGKEA